MSDIAHIQFPSPPPTLDGYIYDENDPFNIKMDSFEDVKLNDSFDSDNSDDSGDSVDITENVAKEPKHFEEINTLLQDALKNIDCQQIMNNALNTNNSVVEQDAENDKKNVYEPPIHNEQNFDKSKIQFIQESERYDYIIPHDTELTVESITKYMKTSQYDPTEYYIFDDISLGNGMPYVIKKTIPKECIKDMFLPHYRRIIQIFIEIRDSLGYTSKDPHLFSTLELIEGLNILQNEYNKKYQFPFGYDKRFFKTTRPIVKTFSTLYMERKTHIGAFTSRKKQKYDDDIYKFYTNETMPDPPKQEWQKQQFGLGVASTAPNYNLSTPIQHSWTALPQRQHGFGRGRGKHKIHSPVPIKPDQYTEFDKILNLPPPDETTALIPKSFDKNRNIYVLEKPTIYSNMTVQKQRKPNKRTPQIHDPLNAD